MTHTIQPEHQTPSPAPTESTNDRRERLYRWGITIGTSSTFAGFAWAWLAGLDGHGALGFTWAVASLLGMVQAGWILDAH